MIFFDVLVLLNLIIGRYSYDVLTECTLNCFLVLLTPFFSLQAAILDSSRE